LVLTESLRKMSFGEAEGKENHWVYQRIKPEDEINRLERRMGRCKKPESFLKRGNMNGKKAKQLSKQLKNIGPKLAEKLVEAGIDSPEKLRKLGAQGAFDKMYHHGDKYGDFNAAYLYALEGAIRDCDWLDIPEAIKKKHKMYANELQKMRSS